jgi:putative ABC transport system substrate-binding protein
VKRRQFISMLGGAAAWPLAARAQQVAKLPTIGVLGSSTSATMGRRVTAFVQRLRELGWIEGRTIVIEYRWTQGSRERAAEMAAEFVRLSVDVIVTSGTPTIMAAKQATAVIPIVFANATDPVGSGLVASLGRPGGNVTGLSSQQLDSSAKRLALLREAVPNLRRVGFMGNTDIPPILIEMREVREAASALGLECETLAIRQAHDIAPAIDELRQRAEGLYVAGDALTDANRFRINILALGARLPTIWGPVEFAEFAGLMSYGLNLAAQWGRAGDLTDKILRGTKPGEIPVEQPTKFDLVINLIVARALGVEVPPSLLARADEVIE